MIATSLTAGKLIMFVDWAEGWKQWNLVCGRWGNEASRLPCIDAYCEVMTFNFEIRNCKLSTVLFSRKK